MRIDRETARVTLKRCYNVADARQIDEAVSGSPQVILGTRSSIENRRTVRLSFLSLVPTSKPTPAAGDIVSAEKPGGSDAWLQSARQSDPPNAVTGHGV